ncbi:putative acyl-CoA synthetase YngI [Rhipicephalus microplus]|uniref:putative acyl-CoA synthetase YngI n=1 Tax=Rhipicephalus microplus TaxID=6941 RepID=UPI003F6A9764
MLQRCFRRAAGAISLTVSQRSPRYHLTIRHVQWREASRLSYYHAASEVPLLPLTMGQVLDRAADTMGDNLAVVSCHQGISKTYAQFKRDVDHLAAALVSLGLPPGAMIGILASNMYEWPVVQFATAKAGLVLVNVNTLYQVQELEYCLKLVDCEALIVSEKFARQEYYDMMLQIAPELERCKPGELKCARLPRLKHLILLGDEAKPGTLRYDDLLAQTTKKDYAAAEKIASKIGFDAPVNVQFTSGTTGKPKGALLSHFNIVNNANSMGRGLGLHEQHEIICLNVPMIHCFGCVIGTMGAVVFGSTVVIPSPVFNAFAGLQAVTDHRCTVLYGTPTMYIEILKHLSADYDISSLRKGAMGGAPCLPEVIKKSIERLNTKTVHIAYGATECSPVITTATFDASYEKWVNSVGKALDHVEVKVVDSENNIVPVGTPGELCARGYLVFLGYQNDPVMTEEVVRDKWYHTGDEAIMTEDGHVVISGRISDMICRGGENVYPLEIEEFLYTHPDIEEVQVVGVPDKKFGEEICAWVVLKEGSDLSERDLKMFCDGRISRFKTPKYIFFVDSFPKTVSGKIQKFKIREESRRKLNL